MIKALFVSIILTVLSMLSVSGCDSDTLSPENFTNLPAPPDTAPFKEIYDAGLAKYVGKSYIRPSRVTPGKGSPRIDTWHFPKSDTDRGPLCMRGSEFFIETRDGSSGQLLIFLEGGGVCLKEICCATAEPLMNLKTMTLGNLIGIGGVLDHYNSRNPMADFDVVHIPYCDGSIFMGDVDRVLSDGKSSNGTMDMAYQRGLQNLTAGFEVAKYKYPNPSRIVLAGTSGGGYGILAGTALARYYYPDAEIVVIADSAAPMMRDNDKDFLRRAMTELNVVQYIPASCPDCIPSGHLAKLVAWALDRDDNFRVAYMSHADDKVIGDFYMKSPSPILRNAMLRETGSLADAYGSRFHRFITPGTEHVYLLNSGSVLALFGTLLLSGDDVDPKIVSTWNTGSLYETGIDQLGKEVTGYQWIAHYLDDPETLSDVVDVDE